MNNNTREMILIAAVKVAKRRGFHFVKRDEIATKAGVSTGGVNGQWESMDKLKTAIMKRAVRDGHLSIVGQGLAYKHPAARKAPQEMKAAATAAMMG